MTEFDFIFSAITHPAAYEVNLFSILSIGRMEDGRFSVILDNPEELNETVFKDPEEAVRFFLEKRKTHQLGLDYESENFENLVVF